MKKPVIAIPIGDPAGVGPEIVAKSIASDEVFQIAVCVIVGDRKILEKAIEITGENLKINEIKEPDEVYQALLKHNLQPVMSDYIYV